MQIQITIDGTKPLKEVSQQIHNFANILWPYREEDVKSDGAVHASTPEVSGKPAKAPAKKTKAAPKEEETFGEEAWNTDETETPEEEEAEEPNFTQKDIELGFAGYAKENGRDAAMKILGKFKAKSVKQLVVAQYPAVMKALGN